MAQINCVTTNKFFIHNGHPITSCRTDKRYFWKDTGCFVTPFSPYYILSRCIHLFTDIYALCASMHYLYLYKNGHMQQKGRNLICHQHSPSKAMCKIIRHNNKFWIISRQKNGYPGFYKLWASRGIYIFYICFTWPPQTWKLFLHNNKQQFHCKYKTTLSENSHSIFQITGKTKHHLKVQDLIFLVSGNTSVILHARYAEARNKKPLAIFWAGKL